VIAFDFSKAFDTIRQSTILSKLSSLPIDDSIYNWFVNYFCNHSHVTKFCNSISDYANINASVFQGSVVGPSMFNINGIDFKPINTGNYLDKSADDSYLIIPSSMDHTVESELNAIESWASLSNLKLNKSKSKEMVIFLNNSKRLSTTLATRSIAKIDRVDSLTELGVTFTDKLDKHLHVSSVCAMASQTLYAIKLLQSHGLDHSSLTSVSTALIVSRLTYASPAWIGFTSAAERAQLAACLKRATRWRLYDSSAPPLDNICIKRDKKIFNSIIGNPSHVLYQLLPPEKPSFYNMRKRGHNHILPSKLHPFSEKIFTWRMLYNRVIW